MATISPDGYASVAAVTISVHSKSGGEEIGQFLLHYDCSCCGVSNLHYPVHAYGKQEEFYTELYSYLWEGFVYDNDEFSRPVSIVRMSSAVKDDDSSECRAEAFYQWMRKNHPGVMTRHRACHNVNSGNLIATYNFYTQHSKEC